MRFLHLNHRYHPFTGGSELYVKEISERLAALGHQVTVVASMASDLEFLWDQRRRSVIAPASETVNGVNVRRLEAGRFPGQQLVTPAARRAMGELGRLSGSAMVLSRISSIFPKLQQLEESVVTLGVPDVILATNIGLEGMAITALRVARRYEVPFVLIPFTHVGADSEGAARRYVSMPHQLALLKTADLVLTLTDFEAQFMRTLGVSDASVRAIYCGASESGATGGCGQRLRRGLGMQGILIGALGALAPEKGTPALVEAVARLRGQGAQIELVLAGPAMTSFERWWDALPEEKRQGVHLLGMIHDEVKKDFLDAIDILALPSRTESFGIVYLEAWLNRKPVIAARAGAVSEVVSDEENGLLVEYGNVEELATAIARLSSDRTLRDRLGSSGRERARSHYTWDRVFRRFRSAYADVLGVDIGEAD